jgi:hypothetical protein
VHVNQNSIKALIAQLAALPPLDPPRMPPEPPLPPGGGGDNSGDMEARIAKLEAHVEHILSAVSKLEDLPTKVAVLEERVSHLPTKGWMMTALLGGLTVIAALIAFSEKIHALIH